MRTPLILSLLLATAVITANTGAFADEHDGHQDGGHNYVHHQEWHKGARMKNEDWSRGEHVDYKQRHLRRPPHGYEWREVDGNYVLAAVATGVIASVIAATIAGH
jgi:Ni/Co efflux regulator RcnB